MSDVLTINMNGRPVEPEGRKVSANLNGTGVISIRGSLDIFSMIDVGAGDCTFNFAQVSALNSFSVSARLYLEN